jgi:hypothetical protein
MLWLMAWVMGPLIQNGIDTARTAASPYHAATAYWRGLVHEVASRVVRGGALKPIGQTAGLPTGIHADPFHRERPSCESVLTQLVPSQ